MSTTNGWRWPASCSLQRGVLGTPKDSRAHTLKEGSRNGILNKELDKARIMVFFCSSTQRFKGRHDMDNNTCHCVTKRCACSGLTKGMRITISLAVGMVIIFGMVAKSHGEQYKMMAYGEGAAREPRFRTMESRLGWSNESSALPVESDARWAVLRACPRREEVILGVIDADYNLTVQTWNGIGWSNVTQLVNNTGSGDARFFDIAYESQSGNAVVVYGTDEGRSPRYRVWNGTRWSRERTVALPGDRSRPQYWVILEPDIRSDEIVLVCQDDYRRLYAGVWDGKRWGNCLGEFDKSKTDNYLGYGVCRLGQSGDVMVTWRPEEQPHLQYMFWNGATWGPIVATQNLPLGTDAGMVEMSADPRSDRAFLAVGDIHGELALATWSGSEWSAFERLGDNCRAVGESRSWDVAFCGEGRGILVYSEGADPQLRYRIYHGNWDEERLGPTLKGPINVLQLVSDRVTGEVILLSLGEERNLESMIWDGAQFTPPDQLETNVSVNHYEPFSSVFVVDEGPSVMVLSPNGGEQLEAGRIHMIRWQASQDLGGGRVNIYYTTSGVAGGLRWKPVVLGEVNRFEHPWMVPFEPSEHCLVRVEVFDESMRSSSDLSDSLFVIYTNTGTEEDNGVTIAPREFELLQNEPNPFHASTAIRFLAPLVAEVRLTIYDSGGRQIREYCSVSVPGENSVIWDGKNDFGHALPPGVYFGRLSVDSPVGRFRAATQMIKIE